MGPLGDHGIVWTWLGDGLLVVSDDRRAWLHVGAEGFVTVASGKVDVGQGSAGELAGVVVAELHAVPASVRILLGDTDFGPYDAGTFGSRTTPDVVPSVAGAAAAARASLEPAASAEWGVDPGSVSCADGTVATGDGRHAATFAELVRGLRRVEFAAAADGPQRSSGRVMGNTDIVTGRRRYRATCACPTCSTVGSSGRRHPAPSFWTSMPPMPRRSTGSASSATAISSAWSRPIR